MWEVRSRRGGDAFEAALVAYWEVSMDPISDDYTPREISAADLFDRWARTVTPKFPNGLIPVYWSVQAPDAGICEVLPFQFDHCSPPLGEDFLTYFNWPVDARSGDPLNWLELPVVDKLWNARRAEKGGFIQQATGWKPSIFQSYVYLPSLIRSRERA
jgi:hypothetical protein